MSFMIYPEFRRLIKFNFYLVIREGIEPSLFFAILNLVIPWGLPKLAKSNIGSSTLAVIISVL